MKIKIATDDELDRMGASDPVKCRICPNHQCGGCGVSLKHTEGTTCAKCWELVTPYE